MSSVEAAKKLAADRAVAEHFCPSYKYVGIGSGSTIKYVVEAIARTLYAGMPLSDDIVSLPPTPHSANNVACAIAFVPTGYQSHQMILDNGLMPMAFDSLPRAIVLDVAFDGADEVDEDLNAIKGGGACLFQEKLVAQRAKRFVCVADFRKLQSRLLTAWPSIPVEVAPIAAPSVVLALEQLGSVKPAVRLNPLAIPDPLKTDQGFFIIDAPFPAPLLVDRDASEPATNSNNMSKAWHVDQLAKRINSITGVLEVGLFCGVDGIEAETSPALKGKGQKPVAAYFGMEDGSVAVRVRAGGVPGMLTKRDTL